MPPHTHVRLLIRPTQSLLAGQLATTANPRSRARLIGAITTVAQVSSPPAICLNCRIQARVRFYSGSSPIAPNIPPNKTNNVSASKPSNTASSSPPPEPPSTAELPSTADSRRGQLSKRFSAFMDNLQSRVLVASQTLNDLTGYTAIESLKASNAAIEASLAAAQSRLRAARSAYKTLIAGRSSTQRELTTLLARKDSWAPPDVERFTALYRTDHEREAGVSAAAAELEAAEVEEARLGQQLTQGILRRYHEEQVWSDRIRRQSTWGTWGLMGVNVVLFLVLQFVAEPWRRARLVRGVAEEERVALEEVRRELGEVKSVLARRDNGETRWMAAMVDEPASGLAATALVTEEASRDPEPVASWKEAVLEPGRWGPALGDLYSERRIDITMRDASLFALQCLVTGGALAAGLTIALLRRT